MSEIPIILELNWCQRELDFYNEQISKFDNDDKKELHEAIISQLKQRHKRFDFIIKDDKIIIKN
jgi:hypothetical protein